MGESSWIWNSPSGMFLNYRFNIFNKYKIFFQCYFGETVFFKESVQFILIFKCIDIKLYITSHCDFNVSRIHNSSLFSIPDTVICNFFSFFLISLLRSLFFSLVFKEPPLDLLTISIVYQFSISIILVIYYFFLSTSFRYNLLYFLTSLYGYLCLFKYVHLTQ